MRTRNTFYILMLFGAITMFSHFSMAQKGKNKTDKNKTNKTDKTDKTDKDGKTDKTNKDSDYNPNKVKLAFSVSADVSKTKDKNAKLGGYTIKNLLALNAKLHAQIPGVLDFLGNNNSLDNPVEPDAWAAEKPKNYFQLRGDLGIQGRGFIEKHDNDSYKTYIYYLTLQPYLLYNHQTESGGNLFAGIGPYVGYGLFGKFVDKVNGQTTKEKIKFGEDQSGLKRGDFGLGLVAGYIINRIFLQLSYDFGLSNIGFDKDNKVSNRALGISVGYMLK